MIAMSVGYQRKKGRKNVKFFDAYTANKHIKWSSESGSWQEIENEDITLLKIPAIYACRPFPIWEFTSDTVYEIEWSLSRNGNYIRENSKPLFCVFADEAISYGDEKALIRKPVPSCNTRKAQQRSMSLGNKPLRT